MVTLGSTRLLASGKLRGKRVGLVCNPASVDHRLRHIVDLVMALDRCESRGAVRSAARVSIRRAGQHDRDAACRVRDWRAKAGAALLALQRHARTDRRDAARSSTSSSSTYKTSARASTPTRTRWPTACARRSNSASRSSSAIARTRLAASRSRASRCEPGNESFVGQFAVPTRHGMTIGELARLFNEHFGIGAGPRSRSRWTAGSAACTGTTPAAVGDAIAEHPDARQRLVFPGHGASRGDQCVRRARDHAAIRARRRAVGQCRGVLVRRLNARQLPGVVLSPGRLRADVSEARAHGLRRLPDSRARSPTRSSRC